MDILDPFDDTPDAAIKQAKELVDRNESYLAHRAGLVPIL